jgi:2-polyprenyl-6-methoxyphenol hydroxylase-like FAD-dependent oxidoreductase
LERAAPALRWPFELARAGQRVLLVDRDEFPSDTLSTHCLWPHIQARLEALGVLARLRTAHKLNPQALRWRGFGHEFTGVFTPCDGFDRAILPAPNRARRRAA